MWTTFRSSISWKTMARSSRWLYVLVIIVASMNSVCTGQTRADFGDAKTPPSFKHVPNPSVLYFVRDTDGKKEQGSSAGLNERTFHCEATGNPEPRCHWTKNGNILNVEESNGRITPEKGSPGTITIRNMQKSDEGFYQCTCKNANGTAVDRPIELKEAYIGFFAESVYQTVEPKLGKPYQRQCKPPPSVPPARVFWIFMDAGHAKGSLTSFQSINSSNIAINDKGSIFIQYVKDNMAPQNLYFTCTAENMELKDYKFGEQFKIKVEKEHPGEQLKQFIPPEEQYVSPGQITALKGESFELFCIFSGFPDQKPIWRRVDGLAINWTKVTFGTNFNKSLKMDNVDFDDEGDYECTFDSDLVNARRRVFRVNVEAAPYWINKPPADDDSAEGEVQDFHCNAAGKPRPMYSFYKNGEVLQSDNSHIIIDGSTLKIVNLRKGENGTGGDVGVYQCNASNSHGYVWANFYLNLRAVAPILEESPGEVTAVVGQTKKLACKFYGSPRPTVNWTSVPMQLGSVIHDRVDENGYTYRNLENIQKHQEGTYECFASNKYGNASGKGELKVREATVLVAFPMDNTTLAGKSIRLPCLATADKDLTPKVKWLFHGQDINLNNHRYKVDKDNTLIIDSAVGSDTGEYTCVAYTDYDNVTKTAHIVVKDVPFPPVQVFVKCDNEGRKAKIHIQYIEENPDVPEVRAHSFFVQLSMDENQPNYWETYHESVTTIQNDVGAIDVTLRPYGNYLFRAVARNDVGDSAPTKGDRNCSTLPKVPDTNPANVLVKGNTPDDFTVYWEPMPRRDWNGPDFHYVVEYRPIGSDEPYKSEEVKDPEASSVTLPASEPNKPYEVRVWAKNALGQSAVTPARTMGKSGEEMPKERPTGFQVKEHVSPTTVTFKWDPYPNSGFKGDLKGFKIEHWVSSRKRAEPMRKVTYFDPAATEGTVYDLKPYANNSACILAYSGGGDGPCSQSTEFAMPEGFATPVQDLELFALSHKEIGVMWKHPAEMNGVFRGYNITWCLVKTEEEKYRLDFDYCGNSAYVNATHYRIKGNLSGNSDYQVKVVAVTGVGLGETNSLDIRTLPFEVPLNITPAKPALLESGIGEDYFNVTWRPGRFDESDPRPLGDDHYVEYREKGTDAWVIARPEEGNFTVRVAPLKPATSYEVRTVSVVNDEKGKKLESRSDILTMTTGGEPPITTTAGWLIAAIVAIIIMIIILIIVCLVVRNRGAKYPVSQKEKEQGREPMLKEERGFGEYERPEPDEEKRSLTQESKPESETDSMAEYGDGETGRFTEDGSFIGQYGAPNKVITAPSGGDRNRGTNLSTFV